MTGRAVAVCVCVCALAGVAVAQDSFVEVKVTDRENRQEDQDDVEKRMVPELVRDLNTAKSDALLLYTDYTSQAGRDMKSFMINITGYAQDALKSVENRPVLRDLGHCRDRFENRLKKIEKDAYKAAGFSSENHHKFLLGHMVVFRMHLNKTEELIRKCERALYGCKGSFCENKPKVKRWKRQALSEIHRVQDDLQHTRRSYQDLVAHARRRLNHIRKTIYMSTADAVEDYHKCVDGNRYDPRND